MRRDYSSISTAPSVSSGIRAASTARRSRSSSWASSTRPAAVRGSGERSAEAAIEDAETDPYFTEGGVLELAEHSTEGTHRRIGSPLHFSATPTAVRRECPTLGQDTADVLKELGWSAGRIAEVTS
jgi:crotonobetainyl-CoA:carnitine CoA-transferase CaiB-like acyl-CoA transferase